MKSVWRWARDKLGHLRKRGLLDDIKDLGYVVVRHVFMKQIAHGVDEVDRVAFIKPPLITPIESPLHQTAPTPHHSHRVPLAQAVPAQQYQYAHLSNSAAQCGQGHRRCTHVRDAVYP